MTRLHAYDYCDEDVPGEEEEESPGEYLLHMWCLDAKSEPTVLTVRGFHPECYIELPARFSPAAGVAPRAWHADDLATLAREIERVFSVPLAGWEAVRRRKLYYYQAGEAAFMMLRVRFHTLAGMLRVARGIENAASAGARARGRWYGRALGQLVLRAWEHDIPTARKLVTAADTTFAGWFAVAGATEVRDSAYTCRELAVDWAPGCLRAETAAPSVPAVLSFDIEAYSDNPLAMPNPENVSNSAYMVSCVFAERGTRARTRVLIATAAASVAPAALWPEGAPDRVVVADTERGLLEAFCELVAELDPDIIIGYNTHGFDYKYLDTRHRLFLPERRGAWDPRLSRVDGARVVLDSRSWRSGAFGISETHTLTMEGRVSIDIMTIVRRDYKLVKYNLDTAAKTILGGNSAKLDVSAREMFARYEEGLATRALPADAPARVAAVAAMTHVAAYAMRDADLVLDIFERVNLWIGLVELSSVAGVSVRDTFARGQQCRIVSALYDIASREGTVLDRRKPPQPYGEPDSDDAVVQYTGGYVQEPIPGIHDNIICVDFASLYPSIMCAYNLSHDTMAVRTAAVEHVFSGRTAAHDARHAAAKHVSAADPDKTADPRYAIPAGVELNTVEFVEYEGGSGVDEHAVLDAAPRCAGGDEEPAPDAEDAAPAARRVSAEYCFEFVADSVRRGILPRLVQSLVSLRSKTRAAIKSAADPVERDVLQNRQLAYKVMANSVYGFVGAQRGGQYSLVECAMSVTARGRELIQRVNRYVEEKYEGRIIYGDSVTGDTPVVVRYPGGGVAIVRIDDVLQQQQYEEAWERMLDRTATPAEDARGWHKEAWERMLDRTATPAEDARGWHKEAWSPSGIEVLTRTSPSAPLEFKPIKRVIRHMSAKPILRVHTGAGYVDVTSDHSLIDAAGARVSPCDLKAGDALDVGLSEELAFVFDTPKLEDNERYRPLSGGWNVYRMGIRFAEIAAAGGSGGGCIDPDIMTAPISAVVSFLNGFVYASEKAERHASSQTSNKLAAAQLSVLFARCARANVGGTPRRGGYWDRNTSVDDINVITKIETIYAGDAGVFPDECARVSRLHAPPTPAPRFSADGSGVSSAGNRGAGVGSSGERYVYDISVDDDCHRFVDAFSLCTLSNTDSSFFELPKVVKSAADCDAWGHRLADELSALFPDPLRLEFEKAVRILCLKKKKYAALLIEPSGALSDADMLTRGIGGARRDNCVFLRDFYTRVLNAVLRDAAPPEVVFEDIMHTVARAFDAPRVADFEIVKSYNPPYKAASYQMNVFGKSCALSAHPPNPGDRLGFVILEENVHDASHPAFEGVKPANIGLRMCLAEVYNTTPPTRGDGRPVPIDTMYYIEHMFEAPIDQLFSVVYGARLRAVAEKLAFTPPRGASRVSCTTPVRFLSKVVSSTLNGGTVEAHTEQFARLQQQQQAPNLPPSEPTQFDKRAFTAQVARSLAARFRRLVAAGSL